MELKEHIPTIKKKVREFTNFDRIYSPVSTKKWYDIFHGTEFLIDNLHRLEKLRTENSVKKPGPFTDEVSKLYDFCVGLAHELLHNERYRKNPLRYLSGGCDQEEHDLINKLAIRIALNYVHSIYPNLVKRSEYDEVWDNVTAAIFNNLD